MEKLRFPLLATDVCDRDHIFLRVTQKVGTEIICAFDRLNLEKLWSMIELWANQKVSFCVKQNLSVEDEMKQQDCRYFLFRFETPLPRIEIKQITFEAEGEIMNIGDILDIETQERPWILFQALFGKYHIRVFPRRDWKSDELNREELEYLLEKEKEELPNLIALPGGELSYYVDESKAEEKEEAEINLWEVLADGFFKQSDQGDPFSKAEVLIKKYISHQQTRSDKEKTRLKFKKGLGTQHQTEWFKLKTQIQTVFERFNFHNSEKLKSVLNGWDHKKKFDF